MKKSFKITTFLLAAVVVASAGENPAGSTSRVYRQSNAWVQEVTGSMSAARTFRVSSDAGTVRIRGAAQPNITYVLKKRVYNCFGDEEAQRYLSQFRISAFQQGDTAVLRGQCEFCGGRKHGSIDFDIVVPKETALVNIQTDAGDVALSSIAGRMEAETGGGSIQIDDVGGLVRASTGGGNVEAKKVGGDLRLETGGGSVRVASANGRVDVQSGGGNIQVDSGQTLVLETGGGSINVNSCNGDLKASTGGGNIVAGTVGGRATLETGGGSIRLASANGPVSAQSGGGSIELYKMRQGAVVETGGGGIIAEFLSFGPALQDSHLETSAGDIVVYLADDAKVNVQAAVDMGNNSHAIQSDFSAIKISSEGGSQWGEPREYFGQGSLNGGGPALKIHTAVGNIELRRRILAAK